MSTPHRGEGEPLMAERLESLGERASAWRERKGYSIDPARVGFKLTEEVGELARALIGEWEGRPDRGDVVREAAQVVIVVASLLHLTHPEADLMTAVADEMDRCGA